MLEAVSGAIGDIAGALGDSTPGAPTKGEPVYYPGESIAPTDGSNAADQAPQNLQPLDSMPIEYIHFGRAHPDDGARFPHMELADDDHADLEEGMDPRAIFFRAGLQRESLLLDAMVSATQDVMKEYESNTGAVGELLGAATSMLMGDDTGGSPPNIDDLQRMRDDIAVAGGKANAVEIKYEDLHDSGTLLHQARADYRKFCSESLVPFYVKKDGGGGGSSGGLMDTVGGFIPDLPGVGDIFKLVTGILFKGFDMYLAMYLSAQAALEEDIEKGSYNLTIRQIRTKHTPVFNAWGPKIPPPPPPPPGAPPPPPPPTNPLEEAMAKINEAKKKAEDAVDDVKQKYQDAQDAFNDFFGRPPKAMFGDASLAIAFESFPKIGPLYLDAVRTVIGIDELPKFVSKIIEEITAVQFDMLKRIYETINRDPTMLVPDAALLELGRRAFLDRMMKLLVDLLPFLAPLTDPSSQLFNMGGFGVGGKQIGDLGLKYLDQAIAPGLNYIMELTMKDLGPRLRGLQRYHAQQQSTGMDVLLGHFPHLLTLTVRNTFFPFWELMVKQLFNRASDILAMGMSPTQAMLGKPADALTSAQDKVNEVDKDIEDVKKKVDKVQQQLSSFDQNTMAAFASDPEGFVDNLLADDPLAPPDADPVPPPKFPGAVREKKGTGTRIDGDKAEALGFVETEPLPPEDEEEEGEEADSEEAPAEDPMAMP